MGLCQWEELTGVECRAPVQVTISKGAAKRIGLCSAHADEYHRDMLEREARGDR